MSNSLLQRVKSAWNAFRNRDPTDDYRMIANEGATYYYRPDRPRLTRGNEKTIITSLYNRIAIDVANVDIKHCQLDDESRYKNSLDTGLNECLTLNPNIDQTAHSLKLDIVLSMLDEGCVAVVPVDTTKNPLITESYDIDSLRTGKIIQWWPTMVKVLLYNDATGEKEEIILPKKDVAIIENPFFAIMNEPNSTMQRLVRKLNILDVIDEQSGSGKMDLIIQLPYVVKSELRKKQAEDRRKDVEMQLRGSKYGIAYIDGTEKVTQLNRPVENNLMKQIEYLTSMLYGQLGFHQSILDGTADEKTMLNYNRRIIEPIIVAIVEEMNRKFLTKTARSQKKAIKYFSDPFKLVPINNIADMADKFTRNEIMSSNEFRDKIGLRPSTDPKANELINSNISQPKETTENSNDAIDSVNASNKSEMQENKNQNLGDVWDTFTEEQKTVVYTIVDELSKQKTNEQVDENN